MLLNVCACCNVQNKLNKLSSSFACFFGYIFPIFVFI